MDSNFKNFKLEIKELCKKYNVVIAHEDTQGGFEIHDGYDDETMKWFMDAVCYTIEERKERDENRMEWYSKHVRKTI